MSNFEARSAGLRMAWAELLLFDGVSIAEFEKKYAGRQSFRRVINLAKYKILVRLL